MPSPQPAADDLPQLSLVTVVTLMLRYRRAMAWGALLLMIAVLALGLIRPRTYSSRATFMLQSSNLPSSAAGLAAQFGLNLPSGDGAQSPDFYADFIGSHQLLSDLASTRFRRVPGGQAEPLWVILKAKGEDSLTQREDAVKRLMRLVTANVAAKTGVVSVNARAATPYLASAMTAKCLELINAFNQNKRQSQAMAERKFTEERVAEANTALRQAEAQMRDFLAANHGGVQSSPELKFEFDRFQRDVTMRQDLYTSLVQSYNQAKIEEVRETPAITTVDQPTWPVKPDPLNLPRNMIFAAIGGAILGLIGSWLVSLLNPAETDDVGVRAYQQLRWEARNDFRRPWRLLFGR